jgi:hypothetical protein
MSRADQARVKAKKFLRLLMAKLPAEQQAILAPLLPEHRKPRIELDDVLKKLETVSLENLRAVELAVLARAAAPLVGDTSSWVGSSTKWRLLETLLVGRYHDVLLEMMVSRAE